MDQATFEAMQNLFADLDTRIRYIKNKTIEGITRGEVWSSDPNIIKRVESLTDSYIQQFEQLRAQFLQTQTTGAVLQSVVDTMRAYGQGFDLLDLQVDEALVQQDLDELSRCAQEDPQFGAMIKPILERFGR